MGPTLKILFVSCDGQCGLARYDNIVRNLNMGLKTDVIYLDFSKAFEKVDHSLSLKKIWFYGVKGRLYD